MSTNNIPTGFIKNMLSTKKRATGADIKIIKKYYRQISMAKQEVLKLYQLQVIEGIDAS